MDKDMVKKMREQMAPILRDVGDEINLAIPMYEDPTRYPVRELIDLFALQKKMMAGKTTEERLKLKEEFAAARNRIKLIANAPERIYLWEEGNVPTQTEYTENPGYIYDHEPDFKPYYLEMLISDDRELRGALILIAGGSHGAGTINECFQTGLEFNVRGFQCFILQCRPNINPWNAYEAGADTARAIRIIRSKAGLYRIRPDQIALAGFSNGGLTGDFAIGYYSGEKSVKDYFPGYLPDELDGVSGTPNAFLCIYGPRFDDTPFDYEGVDYPPTFLAMGLDDFNLDNFRCYYNSLSEHDIPVEVHTFTGHPHGYAGWKIIDGVGNPNFDLWVPLADSFLRHHFA